MRAILVRYGPILLLVILVVLVQTAVSSLRAEFYLVQLTMAAYYALVALGLCLLMGYAGQVSMGHAGFFAIGGYSSAFLTTFNLAPWGALPLFGLLQSLGLTASRTNTYGDSLLTIAPWAAFAFALLATAGVSFLIGIPVLRLRGHYLAMATLAFGVIVSRIIIGSRYLGGADGISEVPAFRLFAGLAITGKKALRVQNYYIAWALVIAGVALIVNLLNSRVGRALRAIHGNEEAAAAMGVNLARYKLATFVISAVYAAIGGACLAHFNAGIGPSEASVMKSVRYVALVAAGGMGSVWGTLTVSAILGFLSLRGAFGFYDDAVFGAILVAFMLFAPEGIFGLFRSRRAARGLGGRRLAPPRGGPR